MSRTIKIKIQGHGADTDAPTAEDLLEQLRDYIDILRGVESAVAADGQHEIVWRVVNAKRQSPIEFEFQAFARHYGTDITRRVDAVARHTSEGLQALQLKPDRPPFFPDEVLKKVEKTYERITNGLSLSEIDFGEGVSSLSVTASTARGAVKNTGLVLKPVDKPYRELGEVEGIIRGVEVDGRGHRLLYLRHRLTGNSVKCVLSGKALADIGPHTIEDAYNGLRVRVRGLIHFRALGSIVQIDGAEIVFAKARTDLPRADDILDEDFTGGLGTEEYLERFRDGRVS
jgi:hypothetical protein